MTVEIISWSESYVAELEFELVTPGSAVRFATYIVLCYFEHTLIYGPCMNNIIQNMYWKGLHTLDNFSSIWLQGRQLLKLLVSSPAHGTPSEKGSN